MFQDMRCGAGVPSLWESPRDYIYICIYRYICKKIMPPRGVYVYIYMCIYLEAVIRQFCGRTLICKSGVLCTCEGSMEYAKYM